MSKETKFIHALQQLKFMDFKGISTQLGKKDLEAHKSKKVENTVLE